MKKIVLVFVLAFMGLMANAQNQDGNGFYVGLHAGIPVGDAGDVTAFAVYPEIGYLFEISDLIDAGFTTGFANWAGEDPFDDLRFIPLAATAKFNLSEVFFVGTDIGFGFNVSADDNIGSSFGNDFYYRPFIGYSLSEKWNVLATYQSINGDNQRFSSPMVGVQLSL